VNPQNRSEEIDKYRGVLFSEDIGLFFFRPTRQALKICARRDVG